MYLCGELIGVLALPGEEQLQHVQDEDRAYRTPLRYTRADAQLRLALVFASASVAGAFSGLLAYLIVKMDGVCGLHGWRWMFV